MGLFAFLFDGNGDVCEVLNRFLELELKAFAGSTTHREEDGTGDFEDGGRIDFV